MACGNVPPCCFYEGYGIDSWMHPEPSVFKFRDGHGELFRYSIRRRESPLSVFCNPGTQQFPVPVCHDGRIACSFEKVFRQAEHIGQDCNAQHTSAADHYSLSAEPSVADGAACNRLLLPPFCRSPARHALSCHLCRAGACAGVHGRVIHLFAGDCRTDELPFVCSP